MASEHLRLLRRRGIETVILAGADALFAPTPNSYRRFTPYAHLEAR